MRYINTSGATVTFKAAGRKITVAPGKECEIPDAVAYLVKARGLPLKPVAGQSEAEPSRAEVSDETPKEPVARMWHDRAVKLRDALERANRQMASVEETIDGLHAQLAAMLARAEAAERERDELIERATSPLDEPTGGEGGKGRKSR